MLADDVVHLAVFLGEGNAEIAFQDVAHVDQVLIEQGFVETILGFEVGADFGGHRPVIHQRITRHIVHGEEGGGGDEPHGDHTLYESLDGIAPHEPFRSASRDAGVGEIRIRTDRASHEAV